MQTTNASHFHAKTIGNTQTNHINNRTNINAAVVDINWMRELLPDGFDLFKTVARLLECRSRNGVKLQQQEYKGVNHELGVRLW